MKKLVMILLTLAMLTGVALADIGINPVPETQGILTSTSLNAVGNFASATDIQWRITNIRGGLPSLPGGLIDDTIYESTYFEDTQSQGVGLIGYDKELDVETSGQISGQWNIEATKQIAFIGIDGAAVVSSDAIMVDGAQLSYDFPFEVVICPFISGIGDWIPTYCNRAEAGSTIDMTVANVRTTTTDRFVMPSSDHPVELNHDIRVAELVTDVPSVGMASAYMDVLIQEAYGASLDDPESEIQWNLCERIEFTEETSADGAITLFDKLMHYESGMVR
jgi:hypothetical protein